MVMCASSLLSAEQTFKETIFQTPSLVRAKISPDGGKIAYIGSDAQGLLNGFILSSEDPVAPAKQLTFFQTPQIFQFFWSGKSDHVLLLKEEEGKGLLQLIGVSLQTQEVVNYSEFFPESNAKVFQILPDQNQIVIGMQQKGSPFYDLYRLDLETKERHLFYKNDSFAKFLIDSTGEIALKFAIEADGSWSVYTKEDDLFLTLKAEEAFLSEFLSADGGGVYFLDSRFSDTQQLIHKSLQKPYQEMVLGQAKESDIDEVLILQGKPLAYASYDTQKKWHPIVPATEEDLAFLQTHLGANFEVINLDQKGESWVVKTSRPEEGNLHWLYRQKQKELSPIGSFSSDKPFAPMYEMVVTARDGQRLVCYYTLPLEKDRGGAVDYPIPLVVFPHGGPFKVRDKYEFDPFHQWLSHCGYAVLSVNFRLSSGFGKAFVNAGNGEWGGKAHTDVLDAVAACVDRGLTEPGKIGIVGGSYGGYESLASLAFSPEVFACCVSICGPSSLKTVLDHVPAYWEFTADPLSDQMMFFSKKAFILSMGGDPEQEEGIAYLKKCSPLYHLEQVEAPLLLIHGKNDHIVAEAESRQIYEELKQRQKQVTYLLFPDEGHRIARVENRLMYLDQAERFLAHYLGGRYEPLPAEILQRSSCQQFD